MRRNYKGFAWRLENIKEVCNAYAMRLLGNPQSFQELALEKCFNDVIVRYVLDENKFGYAKMGDFFFLDDCMYVVSDNENFKDIHNGDIPELAVSVHDVPWNRSEKYVTRVIFAGVRTPYKDNLGDWIYTGDMVNANNNDIISGVCAFPPSDYEDRIYNPCNYGLMLDNCMQPLRDCQSLERLGTIYFGLDRTDTEIDMEQIIGGTVQHGVFSEDFLKCAQYTPSYQKEYWKYEGLEILGSEYNWRK